MEARSVRDAEAAGSSPVIPTLTKKRALARFFVSWDSLERVTFDDAKCMS